VGDRRLDLRAREFDLLAALARDPGVVLTRDALLEGVWGTDFPGETRTVDVHVAEVRKKLGDDGPQIETIRGIGYRLVPPPRGTATGVIRGAAPAGAGETAATAGEAAASDSSPTPD
jgi:DNA-binding winged helix-turn-helix (wHTH) protein